MMSNRIRDYLPTLGNGLSALLGALTLAGLYVVSQHNFLVFHCLTKEAFSICIAIAVFAIFPTYYFCSGSCREKFVAESGKIPSSTVREAGRSRAGRHVHLPDAPADSSARSGELSDLRHGARARDAVRRNRAES